MTGNRLSSVSMTGSIVDPTTYQAATISETQRSDYNAALSTFQTTSFYNAQQFLIDQANASKAQMQTAISQLSAAAVDLQKVITVNQVVASVSDSTTAKAAQTAIANTGIGSEVTTSQVAAYNTSLASVNDYATKTGAFFAAANNQSITSSIDLAASNYNKSLYTATAAYTFSNDAFVVAFQGGGAIGFQDFTNSNQVTAQQFFTQAQFYAPQ